MRNVAVATTDAAAVALYTTYRHTLFTRGLSAIYNVVILLSAGGHQKVKLLIK